MARTSAISLLQAAGVKNDLKEVYGVVIDNVRKDTLSSALKSQNYTGNPAAGSAEYKRFVNATVKDYGTARAAGKGDVITAPKKTVNLDQHKEIVEECAKFDLDTFGVGNIMGRRASNHIDGMATQLDTAFFQEAVDNATEITPTATDALGQLEEAIQAVETVKNEYVQGVPRNMIVIVCTPAFFGAVREKLDDKPRSNVDTAAESFGLYHGVKVYSCLNLPSGVKVLAMATGSVAQPVVTYPYGDAEKIPLSNDYAVALFYDYGAEALTPDLIFVINETPSILTELDVTSVAGTETVGDTVISVDPSVPGTGNKYVYKLGTAYTSFAYNAVLTGYTDLPADGVINVTTATRITVAEVTTADSAARGRGIAIIVKKTE